VRLRAAQAADLTFLSCALHERLTVSTPLPSGEDVSQARALLAIRIRSAEELVHAERTIRGSVIKSTDNKVARWNRTVSLPISVALMRTPLTANQLSVLILGLGLYSGWLFSIGTYLTTVLAALLALAASVLDGSDGEIARLKYQESALGCWIETIADYSFYIAMFIGMTVGVVRWTGMSVFYWIGAAALAGTLLAFGLLIYLRSAITDGQPDRLHAVLKTRFNARPSWWSRLVWRLSMMGMRSAMPYAIAILAITGLIPLALIFAAIGANTYWISLALRFRQLTRSTVEA
jgi:phosphatidylglycerophosphate synthase